MGLPGLIQKYGGQKMGSFLTNIADDINPIRLHAGNMAQKDPDLYGQARGVKDLVKQGMNPDSPNAMTLSQYFKGKKIGARLSEDPKTPTSFSGFVDEEADAIRASTRTVAAGTIAAFGLAPMVLGEDNFVSRTIGAGATAGMHMGITAAALRSGKGSTAAMFGVGYGGLAAVNAIRSGDNFGPF
jgi:hypothetical protein